MSFENPFFHRGAIRRAEEFLGRQAEINQILGLFRNHQSVSIIGPRRIGKSSLLIHLCRAKTRQPFDLGPPKTIFAPVDCQELGGSPPEEVYEALLTNVMDAAEDAQLELSPIDRSGTYRALDRVLSNINRSGTAVVVLLDEFELLAANERLTPYFFARLRGLTTKYGLAYLTASQRPLFAITADEQILSSPFFNIFVSLSLGMFTTKEAKNLLHERLEGTSITFPETLSKYLLHLVGPHPFFLHIAGYHAFQALAQGEDLGPNSDLSQLDAPIEIEAQSHLGYLWQNLTSEEQYCLATTSGPIETMRQLEQQCLIQQEGDGYQYTSEILRRFVRRQEVAGLIQAGPFVIDIQRHEVQADGQELNLTSSQFDLFVRLGERAGQVVSGEELETAVWGDALVDDPDRLKTLIKRLRRAIEPYNNWIASERGVGYVLRRPD
ncbi:MAG: winged helix-turn-helix domain-containing protein [Candidatus Promineifilaceae bacterium]